MNDPRFNHALTDPRFRSIKKKQKKIEIDERFQGVFSDDKFKSESLIDKRGRPINQTHEENLKKFYHTKQGDKKKKKKKTLNDKKVEKAESADEKSVETEKTISADIIEPVEDETKTLVEDVNEPDSDDTEESSSDDDEIDLMRGKGNIESSDYDDSGDEEFYKDEDPSNNFDHKWNELDHDVPTNDNISSRLALCNMDWDRIKAEDIFVMMSSLGGSKTSSVKKVSIYMSEFGKQRIAEENLQGPKELVEETELEVELTEKGEQKLDSEKLRQYQINRLKYYYCVIEFDSAETANKIYTECDGSEFETSSSRLDLRFVPDETSFDDDEPTQTCNRLPDMDDYEPKRFVTTALNQSKVESTWDVDMSRTEAMRRRYTEKTLTMEMMEEMDRVYMRTDYGTEEESSEDEDPDDDAAASSSKMKRIVPALSRTSTADQIDRYRAIILNELDDIAEKDEDDVSDVDEEVTFHVPTTSNQKKAENDEDGEKEGEFFADSEDNDDEVDDDDQLVSDDENPRGKRRRKKNDDDDDDVDSEEEEEKERKKAELKILMMDQQESKHFSLDKIVKEQQEKSKKKKKRRNKKKKADEDDDETAKDNFQIDLQDPRFSVMYKNPDFAIDPNISAFKKTDAMLKVMEERRNRTSTNTNTNHLSALNRAMKPSADVDDDVTQAPPTAVTSRSNIDDLVKSIKRSNMEVVKKDNVVGDKKKLGDIFKSVLTTHTDSTPMEDDSSKSDDDESATNHQANNSASDASTISQKPAEDSNISKSKKKRKGKKRRVESDGNSVKKLKTTPTNEEN